MQLLRREMRGYSFNNNKKLEEKIFRKISLDPKYSALNK